MSIFYPLNLNISFLILCINERVPIHKQIPITSMVILNLTLFAYLHRVQSSDRLRQRGATACTRLRVVCALI